MKDKIVLPIALQIVMDDFGWHEGKNSLADGGPARTAIGRKHHVKDITVLNEIGKRIGMHLLCGFTIGEWDKDNVLRGMKHATRYEDKWDRKSYIDMDYAQKAFEAIESSEYIDIAFHGLMHGYWDNGENYGNPREFFMYDLPEGAMERRLDYPVKPVSAEYVKSHLEAFFKIYNGWGFSKPVRSFISPASLYKDESVALEYAREIEKFGIIYWKNGWNEFDGNVRALRSITFLNAEDELTDYSKINVLPLTLPDWKYDPEQYPAGYSVIGCHWANFLWDDPNENAAHVDEWAEYFLRQADTFGLMLSTDISCAASQAIYQRYSTVSFEDNRCIIDVSAADSQGLPALKNEFFISIDDSVEMPKRVENARIEVYKKQKGFTVYKLTRNGGNKIILY